MTKVENLSVRRYDLDWLRVIAIILLHIFHVGMFFNTWGWHIKNNYTSEAFEYIMVFLHQWRMPLLLFISGAGTIYASSKRSLSQFAKERHNRLMIPLIFSMLVIVPPQIYFERIADFSSYLEFYPTVFDFVPYPMGGSFSWHHMWFVLYLFIYSMMIIPLIKFLKSDKSKNFITKIENYSSKRFGILSFIIIILISQVILKPFFPDETHTLIDDWAYFTFCFLFFLAGILFASSDKIWEVLVQRRRFHLYIMITSLVLMEFLYLIDWDFIQPYLRIDLSLIWDINKIVIAWTTVVTLIGYGKRYLNKNHKYLKYLNEALYPFYILHQTVIIVLAFPLTNWDVNIFLKFLVLNILSFFATVIIYLFIIRPFNSARFLFGMKPKKKRTSTELSLQGEKV